jgi:hypothetical protein
MTDTERAEPFASRSTSIPDEYGDREGQVPHCPDPGIGHIPVHVDFRIMRAEESI